MLQSGGEIRQGFLCPQCHQDMSNGELLQIHFQNVHVKQSSSSVKGFIALARQKLKNDAKPPIEPPKAAYAQYFASNRQLVGYSRSLTNVFNSIRREHIDRLAMHTNQQLLRLDRLISMDVYAPRQGKTKERRKYEQDVVRWMEDSVAASCSSCTKSFGLSRRKHHCRLDGSVICEPCSQFIAFPMAHYLIHPSASPTVVEPLPDTICTAAPTSANESYLRVCVPCGQFLQRRYAHRLFEAMGKNEIFGQYESLTLTRKEFEMIHPNYSNMIDALLRGDSTHEILDAQRVHRQLTSCYQKVDALSQTIAQHSHTVLGRNIRIYAVQLLQNWAIVTRRVPHQDVVERARGERMVQPF